jgi:integrase
MLKNNNNPTKIYCRFKPTQLNDFTCATPLLINRDDWNAKQQQIKLKANNTNKDLINSTLKKLETKVIDTWVSDTINKKHISKIWLKEVLNDFFGQTQKDELHKVYFLEWIKKFINESNHRIYKGKIISPLTIKQYQTTFNKLKEFEQQKKTKLKFENIDLEFYNDFVFYCKTVENLGNNSIGGHIKNIKMWCRNIELDGHGINVQYKHKSFSAISNQTNDIYFTENEIDQIFNYDFSFNLKLSNARDLLIIGLRTGLRISDFMRLTDINIKDDRIRIVTKKTTSSVVIPLHPQVKQILQNNNNELPRLISDQKFNEYIKEVALTVGIKEIVPGAKINPETKRKENGHFEKWQLVTSHICRRTFATLLYGKLPNKVIMAITTHHTESQFLKYIKTSNEEFATILEEHWQNEKLINQ